MNKETYRTEQTRKLVHAQRRILQSQEAFRKLNRPVYLGEISRRFAGRTILDNRFVFGMMVVTKSLIRDLYSKDEPEEITILAPKPPEEQEEDYS